MVCCRTALGFGNGRWNRGSADPAVYQTSILARSKLAGLLIGGFATETFCERAAELPRPQRHREESSRIDSQMMPFSAGGPFEERFHGRSAKGSGLFWNFQDQAIGKYLES